MYASDACPTNLPFPQLSRLYIPIRSLGQSMTNTMADRYSYLSSLPQFIL